jgi:uncharacterized protein YceK
MKRVAISIIVIALLLLSGCAVVRAPKRAYQFMYCNQMNPDGKHCDVWATTCGKLDCAGR